MSVKYGKSIELKGVTPADAIEKVTAALAVEGFGVLTTIDVKATLKKKIDVDFRPYTILGACNPKFAHRTLMAEPDIGLLLPCNVVVEEHDGGARVSFIDPTMMSQVIENNSIDEVVKEVGEGLQRVRDALLA